MYGPGLALREESAGGDGRGFQRAEAAALGVGIDCELLCASITGKRRARLGRALACARQRGA
eukprot:9291767-Pyramimonas_sp.AAC.1